MRIGGRSCRFVRILWSIGCEYTIIWNAVIIWRKMMCVSVGFFFLSLHLIGCSSRRRLSTLVNLIWSIQICNCCQTGDTRFEVSIFALNKSDEHTLSRNDIARAFPSLFPSTFFYINQICVHSFIHFPFQFHWQLCVQSLQKPYGSLEIRFNNMQTRNPIG